MKELSGEELNAQAQGQCGDAWSESYDDDSQVKLAAAQMTSWNGM